MEHEYSVEAVSFSPDGKWLATKSSDTARVWEAATGQELVRMEHVDAVAFSSAGKWLATRSQNTVRVWLWRANDLLDAACVRLPRNLKQDEWSGYLHNETYRKTCPNLP
jgi:WD40 repeat protein